MITKTRTQTILDIRYNEGELEILREYVMYKENKIVGNEIIWEKPDRINEPYY